MAQVQLGLWQHIGEQRASKVMVVDSHPDRLKLAELGAIPIDFRKVPLWNRY
jgi:threonine dehydrogenase-like Zn-dependent dehydrogenase